MMRKPPNNLSLLKLIETPDATDAKKLKLNRCTSEVEVNFGDFITLQEDYEDELAEPKDEVWISSKPITNEVLAG